MAMLQGESYSYRSALVLSMYTVEESPKGKGDRVCIVSMIVLNLINLLSGFWNSIL